MSVSRIGRRAARIAGGLALAALVGATVAAALPDGGIGPHSIAPGAASHLVLAGGLGPHQ